MDMDINELKGFVKNIVTDSKKLKDIYTDEINAPVNYACIFSQTQEEYEELKVVVGLFWKVVKETKSGNIYHIEDLPTVSGNLKILKIRKPDITKPERWDADFTVNNYQEFKEKYLNKPWFRLIERTYMEMIELMEENNDVRVYFSNPPVDRQLLAEKGIKTT